MIRKELRLHAMKRKTSRERPADTGNRGFNYKDDKVRVERCSRRSKIEGRRLSAPFILLVEDNRDDEELALVGLQRISLGHEIVVLRDGAEAVDFLWCNGLHAGRDATSMPAFVLLDLKLPKLDGLSVLQHLRSDERTRQVPVVMWTSSGQESDVRASYCLGANSYVRKPVEFGAFVEAIGTIGTYWARLNYAPPSVA
jgi:two-component system response regulator